MKKTVQLHSGARFSWHTIEKARRRERQNDSLLFSKSCCSVKCLPVAMGQIHSAGKSGSNRGVLLGADVSPGRRRRCMSRGSNGPALSGCAREGSFARVTPGQFAAASFASLRYFYRGRPLAAQTTRKGRDCIGFPIPFTLLTWWVDTTKWLEKRRELFCRSLL